MTEFVLAFVLPAAYALLPPEMRSAEASALLLAIGLQESRFEARRQVQGPARSFWQFELAGVNGVLAHHSTGPLLSVVTRRLRYPAAMPGAELLEALEHHDTLAACFARCLLWTLPGGLPGPNEAPRAWRLYVDAWQPGKPHVETWQANYAVAWGAVMQGRRIPPATHV